jgi:carboxypeptidase Taq
MKTKFEALCTRLGEISDLNSAAGVLSWDQQTYMPPGAAEARAQQASTLRRTAHERFVADEIGELLDALETWAVEQGYDSFEASLVRVARRNYDRQRKVPADLVARMAQARGLAHAAWEKARPADDFAAFRPYLEKNVDLNIELAEALGYEDRRYDALLDRYEPEMKTAQVEALFDEMKEGLRPLVAAIAARQDAVDASVLQREYDEGEQNSWEGWVLTGSMAVRTARRTPSPPPSPPPTCA